MTYSLQTYEVCIYFATVVSPHEVAILSVKIVQSEYELTNKIPQLNLCVLSSNTSICENEYEMLGSHCPGSCSILGEEKFL